MKLLTQFIKLFVICFFILHCNVVLASNILNLNKDQYNNVIEKDSEIKQQLNDYKSVSKWIIDNQENFKQVLEATAKKSSTKWLIDNVNINTNDKHKNITNDDVSKNIYHEVQTKETVYSIAKIYGLNPQEIIILNNLSKDGFIYVGQKLLIQAKNNIVNFSPLENNIDDTTFEDGNFIYPQYKYYQVEKGDTIFSISKTVNMKPEVLIKTNNLDKINLYPGMILKIQANYNSAGKNNINKFEWPIVGRLLISFGPQKSGIMSEGINIMAKSGASVKSVADGVVIYVGNGVRALGNIVLIQHQLGWVSVYGYLGETTVKKGEEVKKSQIIGKVGKLHHIKIPQLHFELREHVTPKDPLEYLNSYT